MKAAHEGDRKAFEASTESRLQNLRQNLNEEKAKAIDVARAKFEAELKSERELTVAEKSTLTSEKAALSAELSSIRTEVANLRQAKTEAEFFSRKCRDLERDCERMRESVNALQEDVATTQQELVYVRQKLDDERRANELHATFTMAIVRSQCGAGGFGSERVEALQTENDRLRHHLESVTQLLNTLENGIECSEKQKSAYVSSLAETQEQIRRLVGHQNSKQRIQYVGKLQQENRELKEEQAKLRAKIDASARRVTQLEQQLRRLRDSERLDQTGHVQQTHNVSTFPRMF